MDNALIIIIGLAIVLTVQIAIHLRIAGIPKRVAMQRAVTEARPPKDDAFQEALARRLNLILRGIQGYHDQIAEHFRIQVAAAEQRARLVEGRRTEDAKVTAELHAALRDAAAVAAELRTLQADLAELLLGVAERQASQPEAPAASPPAATAPEDPDERKTIEVPAPPMTGAPPPASSCAPAVRVPPPAAPGANDGADDEGWDDPEEKTKLFPKDAATSAVLVALGPPAAAKGARPARHALRPPPPTMGDEGDDAMERPSILPEARRS